MKGRGSRIQHASSLIAATPEFQTLRATFNRRLTDVSIASAVVSDHGSPWSTFHDDSPRVYIEVVLQLGTQEDDPRFQTSLIHRYNTKVPAIDEIKIKIQDIVPSHMIRTVILQHLGVVRDGQKKPDIPNYSAKLESILEELCDITQEYFIDRSAFVAWRRRASAMIESTRALPEILRDLRIMRNDHASRAIQRLLKSYSDVPSDVLRQALDEFIINNVMEA